MDVKYGCNNPANNEKTYRVMIPSNSPPKPDSAQLDKIKHSIINELTILNIF